MPLRRDLPRFSRLFVLPELKSASCWKPPLAQKGSLGRAREECGQKGIQRSQNRQRASEKASSRLEQNSAPSASKQG